ncbi:MAG TPA: ComEC/Rec2 family competence protein [Paludibacter sp.]|nr:ComEC/Rec2 family competence protein [Paludibacter sp.]
MDFLHRTPFLRLLLPFMAGIILCQYVELPPWELFGLSGLSACLVVVSFAIRKPKPQFQFRWLFGFGISMLLITFAYFLCSSIEKGNKSDFVNEKGIYEVELVAAPNEKDKTYLCKVEVLQKLDCKPAEPVHGKAYIYLQKDSASSHLLFGDRIVVGTLFKTPDKTLNPGGFDYAAYLKRQGVSATSYVPSGGWLYAGHNTSFSLRREADKCREHLLQVYKKFDIGGDEFAVLAALTLGYMDDLQPDLRRSYSAAGAMHILSVSGLHVAVVYAVVVFLLGFLNGSQRQKVLKIFLTILFLWGYAFLTGLSPSVVRATLMLTFVAAASSLKRKPQIYNTIFMSAFFMLLVNPNLLFDIGFQLSYSAVLSILYFQPMVSALFPAKGKVSRRICDLFTVSIAAQVGTTPFTLYYFHQFPNYFLLTNLVAIPLSTLVIYLSIGLFSVSFIPVVSTGLAFVLKTMLWLMNHAIDTIMHLPYSLSFIAPDTKQTLFLFASIFFLSAYFHSKKFTPLFAGLISILLVCIFDLSVKYNTLTTQKLIVYAGQKNTHVNFIDHSQNLVLTTDSVEAERIANAFWQKQKLENPVYLHNTDWCSGGFACFHGYRILVLTDNFLSKRTTSAPLDLDCLVIGNRIKPKIRQILECVSPRKIIVDKNISKWHTDQIKQTCSERNIAFYSVAEHGAYVFNIKE